MFDLYHYVGSDLAATSNGDLMPVDGTVRGQQRVLRRLLTNPGTPDTAGDYIWHPNYGAGLPKLIGSTVSVEAVRALIRSQLSMEYAVAKSPEPVIQVDAINGGMFIQISYTDALTKTPTQLAFNVTGLPPGAHLDQNFILDQSIIL